MELNRCENKKQNKSEINHQAIRKRCKTAWDALKQPIERVGMMDEVSVSLIVILTISVLFLGAIIIALCLAIGEDEDEDELDQVGPTHFSMPPEFAQDRTQYDAVQLVRLAQDQQLQYKQAEQFQALNPPVTSPIGSTLSELELQYIRDRGIQSYTFHQEMNWFSYSSATADVVVQDKLDLVFTNETMPNTAILNFPLPIKDVAYFEVKLFKFRNSRCSVGLATTPYPLFRLPGYNKYSVGYESDGTIRVNEPFEAPCIWDALVEGDVVGCGYRFKTGTVFFTHNGKKVADAVTGFKMDLYPVVGAVGHCELDVNLGQLGFVFIEANVKKYGFGKVWGDIGVPPAYGLEKGDKILDLAPVPPPGYPASELPLETPEGSLHGPPGTLPSAQPENLPENPPSTLPSTLPSAPPENPPSALPSTLPTDNPLTAGHSTP